MEDKDKEMTMEDKTMNTKDIQIEQLKSTIEQLNNTIVNLMTPKEEEVKVEDKPNTDTQFLSWLSNK